MNRTANVADFAELDRRWYLDSRLGVRVARRLLLGKLASLGEGMLRLCDGDDVRAFGQAADDGLQATVHVHSSRFYSRAVFGGAIGVAESFMVGEWTCDDLTSLVRLFVRNRDALEGLESGWARLWKPFDRRFHRTRANTRAGSRHNIKAHYDLSNEFFALFLDESMMYSSALFSHPSQTLEQASQAKLDRLCQLLELKPSDHLLEIGTGWGTMAIHAAREHGCRVTTTTVSPAQCAHARARVEAEGLSDRVTVLQQDYRDLEGTYDKLVSVEMVEAVGSQFLDTFFDVCADRLTADGRMVLQAITIADRYYERALANVDFIQRYIFPGSFIPSVGALTASAARTDLTPVRLDDIGLSYARTIRCWQERYESRLDEARALGFSPRFERLWSYYLSYCEGGFQERSISDVHMVLSKPRDSAPPVVDLAAPRAQEAPCVAR